jgi:hypothetical protein
MESTEQIQEKKSSKAQKKQDTKFVDQFEKYEKPKSYKKPKGGPEDDTNIIIEASENVEIV